jgi:hypothetical protein
MPAMSGHAGAVLSVSCARGVETPSTMRAGAVLLVRDDGKYMNGGGMEQGSGNAPQISMKIPWAGVSAEMTGASSVCTLTRQRLPSGP